MYVYIDTNIFIQHKFDFHNSMLNKVWELCESEEYTFITTDLHIKEIDKKIWDLVDKNFTLKVESDQVKKVMKTPQHEHELASIRDNVQAFKNNLVQYHENQINAFFQKVEPKFLNTNDIEPMEIFQYFFDKKPPFATSKLDEYRDTAMLLNLKKFAEDNNSPINIISADEAIGAFCEESDKLVYYHSITTWTDAINKHQEKYTQISDILHQEDSISLITNKALEYPFDPNMFESPYGYTIHDVSPMRPLESENDDINFQIISIDENSNEVYVTAQFSLDITFFITGMEPDLSEVQVNEALGRVDFTSFQPFTQSQTSRIPFSISVILSDNETTLDPNRVHIVNLLDKAIELRTSALDVFVKNFINVKKYQ